MKSLTSLFQKLTTSKAGRLITIVVAALVAIVVVRGCQRPPLRIEVPASIRRTDTGELVRTNSGFHPPKSRGDLNPKTNAPVPVLPPIRFPVTNAPDSSTTGPLIPARRLIACKLVNTVDSSSLDTPIIALVTRDVFWQGQLIVPRGTEVHGRAQAHHLRDRIGSQGAWALIWPTSGETVSVNGLALDLDQKEDHWGPTDGSSGLRGTRERAGNAEEVKLFAATFLAGLTQPFQQRQNTVLGLQLLPTVENAALSGTGEVMESYAERLLRTIERESTFVRVPAGKDFYLYTLDPIRSPDVGTPAPVQP